jgi:transcriptional regulator with GAF, ATPase, and Fis domain
VHVDVRVVAATNKDLEQAVADGLLRRLFFRLNVVCVNLPPLRERREEVPILADHFLKKYSVQYNKPCVDLSPDTMRLLVDYDWPGNVRELENLIKRAVILGAEEPIRKEISHGVAMAAQRLQSLAVSRQPSIDGRHSLVNHRQAAVGGGQTSALRTPQPAFAAAGGAVNPMTPTEIACAARRPGWPAERHLRTAARDRARAHLQDAPANAMEPEGNSGDHGISYKALLTKSKKTI